MTELEAARTIGYAKGLVQAKAAARTEAEADILEKEIVKIARKMRYMGIRPYRIRQCTGLSESEIESFPA